VAQRFGVAVSSAVKWSQRYRAAGSVAPAKMGGHRKRRLDPHRVFIMERIRQTPHLTLHALKDELAARGVKAPTTPFGCFCAVKGCGSKKRCPLLNEPAPISHADGSAGDPGRLCSTLVVWSS
jgi:putative transposase